MRVIKRTLFNPFSDLKSVERYARELDRDIQDIINAMSGRIRFGTASDGVSGENISGQWQIIADTGVADTEFSVTHTIGAIPQGFLVTNIDKGGVVYDSGTAWTSTTIYLKCSVANAAVTLFLLK